VIWQPDAAAQAQARGQRLFETLFDGEVLSILRRAQENVRPERRGLRLNLVIEPAELHSLPWELLYDKEGRRGFLALWRETPLVRYIERAVPVPSLAVEDKLRLLAVVASPENLPELDLDGELNSLRAALAPCLAQGWLDYQILQGKDANSEKLQDVLRQERYHVFHFLGHGQFDAAERQGIIWLEGPDREGEALYARQLATLLGNEPSIRLAFLNACQTASGLESAPLDSVAGTLVQAGIPAVVATQYAMSNMAATLFSRKFYQALAGFYPVEAAVAEGRKAIDVTAQSYEWFVPVLYLRAQSGYLFRPG
jgi:CHAT domain-containing protein